MTTPDRAESAVKYLSESYSVFTNVIFLAIRNHNFSF